MRRGRWTCTISIRTGTILCSLDSIFVGSSDCHNLAFGKSPRLNNTIHACVIAVVPDATATCNSIVSWQARFSVSTAVRTTSSSDGRTSSIRAGFFGVNSYTSIPISDCESAVRIPSIRADVPPGPPVGNNSTRSGDKSRIVERSGPSVRNPLGTSSLWIADRTHDRNTSIVPLATLSFDTRRPYNDYATQPRCDDTRREPTFASIRQGEACVAPTATVTLQHHTRLNAKGEGFAFA